MTVQEKIAKLISEMTLEEKAALCSGQGPWHTQAIQRLGLPAMLVTDGPHGVRLAEKPETLEWNNRPATCFPTNAAVASSWDPQLVKEIGQALAAECKEMGVHVLLGPGINLKRSPLGGRNFEYYSEDPYLTGQMGTAFVQGLQERGVGASLKHFAANNQEFERMTIDAHIDERTLREIYLSGFEQVVKEAKPWTVMCAYNRINGVYGSENSYLLTDILREEWGFEGFVVSDWGATEDRVVGLKAGLDLEMPGPAPANDRRIVEAVQRGELDEAVLDETVRRYLTVLFQALEGQKTKEPVDWDAHHALARRAAAESMVLLKNYDQTLPLQIDQLEELAVIGHFAMTPRFQGGGSSKVNPRRLDIPLEEIRAAAAPAVRVTYAPGYLESGEADPQLIAEAVDNARRASVAVVFAGLPDRIESEGYDRPHINLPENQVQLIEAVARVQPRTVVVLNNGSAVAMTPWIGSVPAVLEAWLPGQAGGGAIADILFGKVNPSGRLAETFPMTLRDNPSYLNFPGENGVVRYGEGLFVGYRYYDKKGIRPLFPFGYGLSYTKFAYEGLELSCQELKDTDSLTVSLTVTNVGEVAGKEVVQLYVRPHQSRLVRPEKELKAFAKVYLEPGQAKQVQLQLQPRDFAYYDPAYRDWVVEEGDYDILVAKSAAETVLSAAVHIEATRQWRRPLTRDSSIKDWMNDEKGRQVLQSVLPPEQLEMFMSSDSELAAMFSAMPIKKLVSFSQGRLTEEHLEQMIAAANS